MGRESALSQGHGREIIVEVEGGGGSGRETPRNSSDSRGMSRKPKVSFHDVLTEAVRQQSQDTSNQERYQPSFSRNDLVHERRWTSLWNKVKSESMHLQPREPCQLDDQEDDWTEGMPVGLSKVKLNAREVVQCLILSVIMLALACSLSIPSIKRRTLWNLPIWKWELLILALISGRLISDCAVRVVVIAIECLFLMHKRALYFIYGLWRAVKNCLWVGLVLLVWRCLFDGKMDRETSSRVLPYMTKILVCFQVASVIWLLKTLLVKVLASTFHVNTYFERIHEALFNHHVIETLSTRPLIGHDEEEQGHGVTAVANEFGRASTAPGDLRETLLRKDGRSTDSVRGNNQNQVWGTTSLADGRMNRKNVSAMYLWRMMRIIQRGTLSTLDEKILDSNMEDGSPADTRIERQANEVARAIFLNVAKPGSNFIYLDDLMRFMHKDEAVKTIRHFEAAAESNRIDKRALKSWVVAAFKGRRALARSLNDTNTAVDDLHNMLNVIVAVFTLIICLLILGIPIMQFLVFISSQLLLLAFVFGNSCKTVFESIIYLFVMHPYDVGDLCEVDGVPMVVEEMNILTTVFTRSDNLEIRFPNSILATKPISNYNRSSEMKERIDFCLHISTPMEKINKLREKIREFVEVQSDHWQPGPRLLITDLEDMNKITVTLWLVHKIKHQDVAERWSRRAFLIEHMIGLFRENQMEYRMLPLDVNVRNLLGQTSDRLPSNWTACST